MTTGNQVEHFFRRYRRIIAKKGDSFLQSGDDLDSGFFIDTGLVKQTYLTQNGDLFTIHIYKPGSVFPLPSIFTNSINLHNFEAYSDCVIYKAPILELLEFYSTHSDVLLALTTRVLRVLDWQVYRLEILSLCRAKDKIISLLLHFSEVYGVAHENKIYIDPPFTDREISTWTGLTRETVSIHLSQLKQRNLIQVKKHHLVIPDVLLLSRELSV